jgi:hypothetical protein
MNRKIRFLILMILIVSIIIFVQWNISIGNPDFHSGKDGGMFIIFESILVLGTIFFVVMSNTKKILFLFLGFIISLVSTIIIYLVLGFSNFLENVPFHIISCLGFIASFFYIEKLINKNTTNTKNKMVFEADILKKIETDFQGNSKNALKIIENSIETNKFLNSERIIRCIIFLSKGDLNELNRFIEVAILDTRDVIYWAEYGKSENIEKYKRLRNFNKTFEDAEKDVKE